MDNTDLLTLTRDKETTNFNIYSNIVYSLIALILIYYLYFIIKNKQFNNNKILSYHIIISFVIIILTMLNSLYYHYCGRSLANLNDTCKYFRGKGYNFRIISKNDLYFAANSLIILGLFSIISWNNNPVKLFIIIIYGLWILANLSFTEYNINVLLANISSFIIVCIITYFVILEFKNVKYRALLIVIVIFSALGLLSFMLSGLFNSYYVEESKKINYSEPKLTIYLQYMNIFHGLWHLFSAFVGFTVVLYNLLNFKK